MSGINLFLAMTGQEELQYKVFRQFGLNDTEIRSWFNGPVSVTTLSASYRLSSQDGSLDPTIALLTRALLMMSSLSGRLS